MENAMPGAAAGSRNLLLNCLEARPGERLLLLEECPSHGFYDSAAPAAVAAEATAMGMTVERRRVPVIPDAADAPPEVWQAVAEADCSVFFARLGDQVRFDSPMPGKRVAVIYALDAPMLGSDFGRACHRGFSELKELTDAAVARASHIRLTCPLGTCVTGNPEGMAAKGGEVAIHRFPLGIFKPVPAAGFSGRVAIARFVTGTGHRYYDPYDLFLEGTVLAQISGGRVTGYDGPEADRVAAHAAHVGALYGVDCGTVHSWHAGIHPGCAYLPDARANLARWGTAAFANPRVLHFHTCGDFAPGEISWNILDPTIELDGVAVWEAGVFHPDRIAGGAGLLARNASLRAVFANPSSEVGIPDAVPA